jgi:hypothetical protein
LASLSPSLLSSPLLSSLLTQFVRVCIGSWYQREPREHQRVVHRQQEEKYRSRSNGRTDGRTDRKTNGRIQRERDPKREREKESLVRLSGRGVNSEWVGGSPRPRRTANRRRRRERTNQGWGSIPPPKGNPLARPPARGEEAPFWIGPRNGTLSRRRKDFLRGTLVRSASS